MKRLTTNQHIDNQTFATIGFFDGVHLGHHFLLEQLKDQASRFGLQTLVVSFRNSPLSTLNPQLPIKLLSTPEEKLQLLKKIQIDNCLLLDFDEKLSQLTAKQFLLWLKQNYNIKKLLMGFNHRFGSDGITTFDDYQQLGNELGIDIVRCQKFNSENEISSSKIRTYIVDGYIEQANQLLGYTYAMCGEVVKGEQIGRQIGFPTANLKVHPNKLIPKNGVYVITTYYENRSYIGLLNIGTRPTVAGKFRTIEVHFLNFSGNLYNQQLTLCIEKRLRDEYKFESLDELKFQIKKDINSIQRIIR